MTTDEKPRIKITYATLRADNEDLHTGFEDAVALLGPEPNERITHSCTPPAARLSLPE